MKQRLLRGLGAMSRAATAVAVWLLAEVSAARASAAAERSGAVPLGGGGVRAPRALLTAVPRVRVN